MKITMKIMACNLECKYCHFQFDATDIKDLDESSANEIKTFLKDAPMNGVTHIHWTGGEPTCSPYLVEFVSLCKDMGLYQSMATNGTRSPEVYMALRDAGISRVNVSLDTLKKRLYFEITGQDALDTVVSNINLFAKEFEDITKVNMVVTSDNITEIKDVYETFSKGATKVVPRFLELIEKEDIEFCKEVSVPLEQIKEALPSGEQLDICKGGKIYTNPTAQYFKGDYGLFALVPENRNLELLNMKYSPDSGEMAIQKHI